MPDHRYWEALHESHRGGFAAVGYAALGEGFNRECYRRLRLPALRRLLGRWDFQPRSVLEAGVGTGAYAALWEEVGIREWVGVDVSRVAVADLKARFPDAEFHVVDLGAAEGALAGRTFDLVTAIDVLYHIVQDDAFERALTWLAGHVGGGGLVISDVFTDSPWGRRFAHVKRRPLVTYERILQPFGLRLQDREPVFAILGDPVPDGRWRRGWALYQVWRMVQKSIRVTPARFRGAYGAGVVTVLWPIDRAIARTGRTRGINLELALFVR